MYIITRLVIIAVGIALFFAVSLLGCEHKPIKNELKQVSCPFCNGSGYVPAVLNTFDEMFGVKPHECKCSICDSSGSISRNLLSSAIKYVAHHVILSSNWEEVRECHTCDGKRYCENGKGRMYEFFLRLKRGDNPYLLYSDNNNSRKISILAFVASWCEPCRKAKPILIAIRFNKGVNVIIIDIDKHPEMAESCGITSIPTYFVYVEDKRTIRTQDISVVVKIVKENTK